MFKPLLITTIAVFLAITAPRASTTRFQGYTFESYVLSDLGYRYGEVRKNNRPWIQVEKEEAYSLVINNPLPVRVAVAVTIDGLNVIDGKRTTPEKAQKWIIGPNSSLTLRGWQTDRSSLRRFVFTDKNDSYAQWRGKKDHKPYTRNLGVIGIAWFWNGAELYAFEHPPRPFFEKDEVCNEAFGAEPKAAERSEKKRAPARSQAGTGMGHRESNNVVEVDFHYDTGMYRAGDILTIYYEFARAATLPHPFIDDGNRGDFAPEMPW
jgi:hypothetical protein